MDKKATQIDQIRPGTILYHVIARVYGVIETTRTTICSLKWTDYPRSNDCPINVILESIELGDLILICA